VKKVSLGSVLICEKNKEVLDEISISLQAAFPDCILLTTDSGRKCISIAQEKNPDIFILGLDITDMCGFELIRAIRSLFENYIIVLSNTGDEYELVKTMKEGADRYMKQPVHDIELIARIKALMLNESIDNQHNN
jgi:two-component system KDP operon response regulator KdpE